MYCQVKTPNSGYSQILSGGRRVGLHCTQFLKVWGAAEATCQRWYTAGCRTIDDLRARNDLTEQQVLCSPIYVEAQPIMQSQHSTLTGWGLHCSQVAG